jgi:hypothetical protein
MLAAMPRFDQRPEIALEDKPINVRKDHHIRQKIDIPLVRLVGSHDHLGRRQGEENRHDAKEEPLADKERWNNKDDQNRRDDKPGAKRGFLLGCMVGFIWGLWLLIF